MFFYFVDDSLADMQQRCEKRPLEGNRVVLLPIRTAPSSILVRNVGPNLSQDNLFYYFDNPRSGCAEEGGAKDCVLYAKMDVAVVFFRTSAGDDQ